MRRGTLGPALLAVAAATAHGEVEVRAGDSLAIELAPTGIVEAFHQVEAAGRVVAYVRSDELDPRLVVRDLDGALLAEDDDSGGGTTALVELDVEEGDVLLLQVVAGDGRGGGATLSVRSYPATAASRTALERATSLAAEASRLRASGGAEEARHRLREAIEALLDEPSASADGAVLDSLWSMGQMAWEVGALEACAAAWRTVHSSREANLPPELPLLADTRRNLANALWELGDLGAARRLHERVLAGWREVPAETEAEVWILRHNHALLLRELGDLWRARELQEQVLEGMRALHGEEHERTRAARQNLAITLAFCGDRAGSRALLEGVLAEARASLPADHADVQRARNSLATPLLEAGDLAGARALYEAALAALERTLPDTHPDVARVRANLALVLRRQGDVQGARRLLERVLATHAERGSPPEHPDLLATRLELATTLRTAGRAARARELCAEVVPLLAASRAADDLELLRAREEACRAAAAVASADGGTEPASELEALDAGIAAALARGAALSSRELRERAAALSEGIACMLELGGEAFAERTFARIETQRSLALASPAIPPDEASRALNREAAAARRRVQRLVDQGAVGAAVVEAVRDRDKAEEGLRAHLKALGRLPPIVDPAALAAALPARAAAVGYWRVPSREGGEPRWIAHVLRGKALVRVDLGAAVAIEETVARWRRRIAPAGGRGPRLGEPVDVLAGTRSAGEALRERILDPVLEVAGGAELLYLVPDGVLHLVPFDALPLGEGVVADDLRLHVEVSFARLLSRRPALPRDPSLLALGDVDFGSPARSSRVGEAAVPPPPPVRGDGTTFAPLPESAREVRGIAVLFERRFERQATVLTGDGATKAILCARAPDATHLHLATHAYFAAPEWSPTRHQRTVRGMAPLALCGVALAGAGRTGGEAGEGILTGEELAGLDLSGVSLAVLSACETGVGEHGGLGLSSLRTGLHAAGVRTALTSLWKVPDGPTRELMLAFYEGLWNEGLGPAEALEGAKRTLRSRGAPVRDWGAWVLTGDPGGEIP